MDYRSKKIVFLSGELTLGGAATFVLNICDGFQKVDTKWQSIAAVFTQYGAIGEQILNRNLPITEPYSGALLHEDYMERMHQDCQGLQPEVIVASLGGDAFDFLRFVPESVLRVAMIHSDDEGVYEQVTKYSPWIDLIVGVSARNCEVMRERLGMINIPVSQMAYGVPMPESVNRETSNQGPLRVLYLGRVVEEQKRASLLTRVIRETLEAGLDLTWTIAGDGPDLAALRESFVKDSQKVRFLGAVDYSEVPALLTSQDVYFLCSDYEGLPLSLLEAMGTGCVPVVSDLPSGISEVVDEENGIRVPISGSDGYVAALESLCSDRDRLTTMASKAASTVREEYSTIAMARRWSEMLDTHAKPSPPDWSKPCTADAPPACRAHWYFSPHLRWIRKVAKLVRS